MSDEISRVSKHRTPDFFTSDVNVLHRYDILTVTDHGDQGSYLDGQLITLIINKLVRVFQIICLGLSGVGQLALNSSS